MPFTLSDLLQAMYTELGQLEVATATGGSTTTVLDSKQIGRHKEEDWKNGTLFIVAAESSAPEGEFKLISSYDVSNGTFTVDAAFSASVTSGDTYGLAVDYYPRDTMIELANAGLRSLGDIALVDTTSLDTAAGTTEYATAVAWQRRRPLAVDYQGRTGESGDNQWVRVYDWEFVPNSPGESGLIVFDEELPAERDIRVWYVDRHPRVSIFSDEIAETIAPELAVAAGLERALRWQNSRLAGGDPFLLQRWNDAKVELARAQARYPVWTPGRVAKLMTISQRRHFPGDQEAIRTHS